MRAERLLLFTVPVLAGLGVGFLLPRWRTVTIEFAPGGRHYVVQDSAPRTLPGRMLVDDDGHLRLRVLNRDSVPHQVGVLGVAPRDSAMVGAELCTGQDHGVSREIVLR